MPKYLKAIALAFGLLASFHLSAADMQLRIGTLVPKNSLYHRQLMEIGEAWRTGMPRYYTIARPSASDTAAAQPMARHRGRRSG